MTNLMCPFDNYINILTLKTHIKHKPNSPIEEEFGQTKWGSSEGGRKIAVSRPVLTDNTNIIA